MMMRELRKHFPSRAPEWVSAGTLAAWGAYVATHPDLFDQPAFAGLLELAWGGAAPAVFWGSMALIVGFTRLTALFVNGAYSRTPLIRLACSLVSAFVWTQIVIGFWLNDFPNTGLVMYSSAVVMDLISAYRASRDVAIAETTRRATRAGAQKSVNSGGTGPIGVA